MLGLSLLAAHLVGDFLLQTDRMAAEKFDSHLIRTYHVTTYTLPFLPVAAYFELGWVFLLANAVVHWLIDTRRWAEPTADFRPYPLVVDQTLHIASLAICGTVLTATGTVGPV